jgi:hypothetical protein
MLPPFTAAAAGEKDDGEQRGPAGHHLPIQNRNWHEAPRPKGLHPCKRAVRDEG